MQPVPHGIWIGRQWSLVVDVDVDADLSRQESVWKGFRGSLAVARNSFHRSQFNKRVESAAERLSCTIGAPSNTFGFTENDASVEIQRRNVSERGTSIYIRVLSSILNKFPTRG